MKANAISRWVLLNINLFAVGIALGAGRYPVDLDGLRCTTYEPGKTLAGCFQFGAILGVMTGRVFPKEMKQAG